jgi:hypothetical protein
MAIAKLPHLAEVGQYVKLRGHRVSDANYLQWWKITAIADGVILMVNRHKQTSRIRITTAARMHWKVLIWEPGDPRQDETLADLPR